MVLFLFNLVLASLTFHGVLPSLVVVLSTLSFLVPVSCDPLFLPSTFLRISGDSSTIYSSPSRSLFFSHHSFTRLTPSPSVSPAVTFITGHHKAVIQRIISVTSQ